MLVEHKTGNRTKLRENIHMGSYRSEVWVIGKMDQKRIEAFKTWCWRRVLKIKCTENVRNEEVCRRKDSVEHHTPKKNKVGWPRNETQKFFGKYNGGKN
jgi:hypothetical protein